MLPEHQLERSTTRENFVQRLSLAVHGDEDRNEGFLEMYMRLLGLAWAQSEMAAKGIARRAIFTARSRRTVATLRKVSQQLAIPRNFDSFGVGMGLS
jgi:hypothetical protein